jgi:hypothetical protein
MRWWLMMLTDCGISRGARSKRVPAEVRRTE